MVFFSYFPKNMNLICFLKSESNIHNYSTCRPSNGIVICKTYLSLNEFENLLRSLCEFLSYVSSDSLLEQVVS